MIGTQRRWLCSFAFAVFAVFNVALVDCQAQSNKEAVGTGLGAIVGGLIGSQIGGSHGRTGATIGGVIVGGAIGNAIGKRMDEEDHRRMSEALERNSAGQSSSWQNTTTGASYTVTPGDTVSSYGRQCRAFTQEAIIDGEPKKISGTACRRPDGTSWEAT